MTTPEDVSHHCTGQNKVAASMRTSAERSRLDAMAMLTRAREMMQKAVAVRASLVKTRVA